MIGTIIQAVAGFGVGTIIESAVKHVRPKDATKVAKVGMKIGSTLLTMAVTEATLDYGKKKFIEAKKEILSNEEDTKVETEVVEPEE